MWYIDGDQSKDVLLKVNGNMEQRCRPIKICFSKRFMVIW
jgi:hypothetical protein